MKLFIFYLLLRSNKGTYYAPTHKERSVENIKPATQQFFIQIK